MSEGENNQNEMVENNNQQEMSREEMAIAALEEQGLLTSRNYEETPEEEGSELGNTLESEMQNSEESNSEASTKESNHEPSETQEVNSEAFDEAKYLNETFGEQFKSAEEVKSILSSYEKLQNEVQDLRSSQTEPTKFANEYIEGLNNYVLNGGDPKVYSEIVTADYDSMDDLQAIKTDYMNQHGLSEEDADTLIQSRYKLDEDQYTADEIRLAKVTMKVDATDSRKRLKEVQSSVIVPEAQKNREEHQQNVEAMMEKWDDESFEFSKSFKDISFEDKELGDFKYELTEEDAEAINNMMYDAVADTEMEYTPENVEAMKKTVRDAYIGANINKIISAAVRYANSNKEKENFTKQHNPTPVPKTEQPEAPVSEPTRSDIAEDIFMREVGLK